MARERQAGAGYGFPPHGGNGGAPTLALRLHSPYAAAAVLGSSEHRYITVTNIPRFGWVFLDAEQLRLNDTHTVIGIKQPLNL